MSVTQLPSVEGTASGSGNQSEDAQKAAATLLRLRNIRNSLIGSSNRKIALVASQPLTEFIDLLAVPLDSPMSLEIRAQAANVIGSLAQSASTSRTILHSLLKEPIVQALVNSLNQLVQEKVLAVRPGREQTQTNDDFGEHLQLNGEAGKAVESTLRAMRALFSSSSPFVTPSTRWGLGSGCGFLRSTTSAYGGSQSAMLATRTTSSSDMDLLEQRRSSYRNLRSRFEGSRTGSPAMSTGTGASTPTSSRAPTTGTRTPTAAGEVDDGTLRLLIRSAISLLYADKTLRTLLSCLFLSRLFDKEREDALYAQSMPHDPPGKAGRRGSNAMSVDVPVQTSIQAATVPASRLSHMESMRLVSIAELVCSVLSNTLATPTGPVNMLTSIAEIYGVRESDTRLHASDANDDSPISEITGRRRRILAFSDEQDSTFRARAEDSTRGHEHRSDLKGKARDDGSQRVDDDMQGTDDAETRGRPQGTAAVSWGQEAQSAGNRTSQTQSRTTVLRSKSRKRGREEEGTVLERFIFLIEQGNSKAQEAALWALSDLVRDSSEASLKFFKCHTVSGQLPTTMLLQLRNERTAPVRLAAFCALAHIIKVHPFTYRTNSFVLSELVGLLSSSEDPSIQVQACFTLVRLITDDLELQSMACEDLDCVRKLSTILERTADAGVSREALAETQSKGVPGPDELTIRLREAALTALVALTYEQDSNRRLVVDMTSPAILPMVVPSLNAAALGVRVAACRLVRSLSRSVSILRTSLVDAGAANRLIAMLNDDTEVDIVKTEVIATICNLTLKFSPMKQLLITSGGLAQLVESAKHEQYEGIRLNALWALKNALYSSDSETKKIIAEALTFDFLATLIQDKSPAIQEQALNIVRNLASSREADIQMTISGFGETRLFDIIESIIWARGEDAVTEHAAYILVNIATGSEDHRRAIINRPNLLDALLYFLHHPRAHIRDAGIWCAINLTFRMPSTLRRASNTTDAASEALNRLRAFGFPDKLRELVLQEETLDVRDRAQTCLARFEQVF